MIQRRSSPCARVAAATVVVLFAGGGELGPTTARGDSPLLLAGTNTIVASDTGATWAVVQLNADVSLPGKSCFGETSEVAFTGTADTGLIALTPIPVPTTFSPNNAPISFVFGHLPAAEGGDVWDNDCSPTRILPAGTYTLAVVHSPGTMTVALTLPGIAGMTTMQPSVLLTAATRNLPAVVPTSPATGEFGAHDNLVAPGLALTFAWIDVTGTSLLGRGVCLIRPGSPPAPDPIAFAPGYCTVAGGALVTPGPTTTTGITWGIATSNSGPLGSYGLGAWYTVPAASTTPPRGGAVGAWVPYAPQASTDVPDAPSATLLVTFAGATLAAVAVLRRRLRCDVRPRGTSATDGY